MTGPENQGAQQHADRDPDNTHVSAPGQIPPPAAPGQFGQPGPGQHLQPGGYPQHGQYPQPGQYQHPGQYQQPPQPGQFPPPGYPQPGYGGPGAYPQSPGYGHPAAGGQGYGQPAPHGQPYQPFVTDPGTAGPTAEQYGHPGGQQQNSQPSTAHAPSSDNPFAAMVKPQGDRKPRVILIAAAVIAVIAIALAVTAFLAPGFALQKKLSQSGLQSGVTKILTSTPPGGYQVQATSLSDVNCPSGQKATKNSTFNCTAKINGSSFTVPITVLNDDGNFQVGRPVAQN